MTTGKIRAYKDMPPIQAWEGIILQKMRARFTHVSHVGIDQSDMTVWVNFSKGFQCRTKTFYGNIAWIKTELSKVGITIYAIDMLYDNVGFSIVCDLMKPLSNPQPKIRKDSTQNA